MTDAPRPARSTLLRRLPVLIMLAIGLSGAIWFRDSLSLSALQASHDALLAYRDAHYALTVILFLLAYVAVVALSLPGATVASLTGGLMFGLMPGIPLNMLAATTGAVLIFLAARAGFGADLARRAETGAAAPLVARLRANEVPALLLMRFLPIVPFFVANLLPAVLNIRLSRFAWTTAVGILPGAAVLTGIGRGLGEVFDKGEMPDLTLLARPEFLLPVLGLIALTLLPLILRRKPRP